MHLGGWCKGTTSLRSLGGRERLSDRILTAGRWEIYGRSQALPGKNIRNGDKTRVGCAYHLCIGLFDASLLGFVGLLSREHSKFMS